MNLTCLPLRVRTSHFGGSPIEKPSFLSVYIFHPEGSAAFAASIGLFFPGDGLAGGLVAGLVDGLGLGSLAVSEGEGGGVEAVPGDDCAGDPVTPVAAVVSVSWAGSSGAERRPR